MTNVRATSQDPADVDTAVGRFLGERTDARGVASYSWLVSVLRSAPGATSVVYACGEATGVVTSCAGQFVVHSLAGEDDSERAGIIDHAKTLHDAGRIRGLALPGDRRTKNLFEEARLPAQVLLH
jgi:hypothetical protein